MAIHDLNDAPHLEIGADQPSEALFDLIQNAPGGLFAYELGADNRFSFVNQGMLDMLGYTEEEFMDAFDGRFPMMVYGPDRARVIQTVDEGVLDNHCCSLRYRIQRKDGSVVWVHDQGRVITTPSGVQEVLVTVLDVTEEHESRLALQEMLNATPAGLITLRKTGDEVFIESINHITRKFMGVTNDELVGRPADEWYRMFVHPEDYVIATATLDELFGPKLEGECMYRMHNDEGEWRWMNYVGRTFPQADGSLLAYGVHIDRTERQRVMDRLREQQQIYQAAVDTARVLVWEFLPAAQSLTISDSPYANECSARLGMPLYYEKLPEGLLPFLDDESCRKLKEMMRKAEEGNLQAEALLRSRQRPDIPQQVFRVTSVVIYDNIGEPVKVCGTAQDITRQYVAADDYRQELARFNTRKEKNLIAKVQANLTRNAISSYVPLSAGAPVLDHTLSYDRAFASLQKNVTDPDQAKELAAFINRTSLIRAYTDGQTRLSMEYRQDKGARTSMWIELDTHLLQNPETSDLECIMYIVDHTEQHLERLMMMRMSELGYEYLGVLDAASQSFSFFRAGSNATNAPRQEVNYTKMLTTVSKMGVPSDELEEGLAKAQIGEVLSQLRAHGRYEFTFNLEQEDDGLHRKLCQYMWLDEGQRSVFFAQSDITEQYREEQERIRQLDEEQRAHRHTSDLLQSILDTTPTAIFWKDAGLRYQGANSAFLKFLGIDSAEDLVGRTNQELQLPKTYEGQEVDDQKLLSEGISTSRISGILPTADGSVRNVAISKSPRLEDGRIVGLVGSFEDVTDEVESAHEIRRLNADLQVALAEAEQASLAEQNFLSNMSHDMRTPLNGIVGFTRMALATEDAAERQKFLEKIDYSGQLLLAMVNDVLDMSKIASGQMDLVPQSFNAVDLIDSTLDSVRMMAQDKQIELVTKVGFGKDLFFEADQLRLQQVLLNVLSNAVKYTPPGGLVSCDLRLLDPPVHGCNTLCTISDDGIGMSEEFQERMFEPFSEEHRGFESASTQGTGLGLSIVKSIVDLMGGRIEVDSAINKGSTFRIYLPIRVTDTSGQTASPQRQETGSLEGKRVMVFEDNDLNAQISQAILEAQGMTIHRVHDGLEGFETFRASEVGEFDALLMDMRMPKMGGLEAARAIRALERPDAATVPIIAMTADAFADDVQACLDAGMNAHISKPIDPDLLVGELKRLCN